MVIVSSQRMMEVCQVGVPHRSPLIGTPVPCDALQHSKVCYIIPIHKLLVENILLSLYVATLKLHKYKHAKYLQHFNNNCTCKQKINLINSKNENIF